VRLPTITPTRIPYKQLLRSTTLREFTGGWNTSDDDLNLAFRYATRMKNCYVNSDGKVVVRDGTAKFAIPGEHIINMEYFINSIIAVTASGKVYRILGDGTPLILTSTLWSNCDFVSFAKFNSHLILCNGIDKPLDITSDFAIDYLQDAATSTNINVPVCKYVLAINRYLVMAGDPLEPDRVHISAKDAAGTWFGDPPPNDATRIDVGSVLPAATVIRGLMAFRGKLVVMFVEGLVFGTLGTYDTDGNHTPNFDDGVEGFGSVSHRTGLTYGDDAIFLDLQGVPSIRRTVLSTSFKPERVSSLIDDEITSQMEELSELTLEDRTFGIHNRLDDQYFLFIPNNDALGSTTETRAFVYTRVSDNVEAWSEFRSWNFTCACKSQQGEVFFGDVDGNIWLYTGNTDNYDGTVAPEVLGSGIAFDWELPWLDFGDRTVTKSSKYISFDTRGSSEFTCTMYVDELEDENGDFIPALETRFSGGEQGQFGGGPQPFGGGRNTSRKRLYAWPCKFAVAKLRFTGTASEGLAFVSISLRYLVGGINL
jgi:hypothetical protein